MGLKTRITTSSEVFPHEPLLMVHLKILVPMGKELMAVVGEAGLTIVPPPETRLQVPADGAVGVFPVMVVFTGVVALKQNS